MKCSICKDKVDVLKDGDVIIWDKGHNAEPINNGRCCSQCNDTIVVPKRINDFYASR